MPHKDPEARRKYERERKRANRDMLNARTRERYASDPEFRRKVLERGEAWRQANREKANAAARRWYAAHRQEERAKLRIRSAIMRHGPGAETIWAALWEEQQGCCYLCGDNLDPAQAHLDHDHRCCPKDRTCRICRRGLACEGCNILIGRASDSPEKLRRIADSLEEAITLVTARLVVQPSLFDDLEAS